MTADHGTAIGWTHAPNYKGETWNCIAGCSFASTGCRSCYAAMLAATRLAHMPTYAGLASINDAGFPEFSGEVRTIAEKLDVPKHWKRPRMVFVNSMSDVWHKEVPDEFIAAMWTVMRSTPQHVYQVLTKRPQRAAKMLSRLAWRTSLPGEHGFQAYFTDEAGAATGSHVPPNVWNGTSIETDQYVFRAEHLRATPSAVRFLSCEPLIGPLPSLDLTGIDWCLIGGESGVKPRPMEPEWAYDLIERCTSEGVSCYMKQAGTVLAKQWGMSDRSGTNIDEMPPEFRVRQWPIEDEKLERTLFT